MRIPTFQFTSRLVGQLQTLTSEQSQLSNEISTGQSINSPADNPVVAEEVMNDQAAQQQLAQFSKNNAAATNISNASYASVSAIQKLVTNAIQIATLGSGVTGPDSQNSYITQVQGLIQQAVSEANTTYNGSYLFGGTKSGAPPFVSDTTGYYSYAGASTTATMETAQGLFTSPYTDVSSNQGMAAFINNLVDLKSALQGGVGAPSLSTVSANLNDSETSIISTVSSIGATQTGLEADEAMNTSRYGNLSSEISAGTAADIAQATVKLTAAQTAYQAALESGAKIIQMSLINYL